MLKAARKRGGNVNCWGQTGQEPRPRRKGAKIRTFGQKRARANSERLEGGKKKRGEESEKGKERNEKEARIAKGGRETATKRRGRAQWDVSRGQSERARTTTNNPQVQ